MALIKHLLAIALIAAALSACSEKTPQEYLVSAKASLEKQEFRAAEIDLKNALKQSPSDDEARYLLGTVYLSQLRLPEAEKELGKALDLGNQQAWLPYAETLMWLGQYEELLNEIPSGAIAPTNPKWLLIQLEANLKVDKMPSAVNLLSRLKDTHPTDPNTAVASAMLAIIDDEKSSALELCDRALQSDPDNTLALTLKASILHDAKDYEQAHQIYSKLAKRYPTFMLFQAQMLSTALAVSRFEEAKQHLSSLPKSIRNHPQLQLYQAFLAMHEERYQEAINLLTPVLQAAPRHPSALSIAGLANYHLQRWEQARRHLSGLAAELPADHPIRLIAADVEQKLNNPEQAFELLRVSNSIESDQIPLFLSVSQQLLGSGNAARGAELLELTAAIAMEQDDAYSFGMSQILMGEAEQGLTALKSYASSAGKASYADVLLFIDHLKKAEHEQAEKIASELAADNDSKALGMSLQAWIKLRENKVKDAKSLLSQVIALDNDLPLVHLLSGNLAFDEGDLSGAKNHYQQLLSLTPEMEEAAIELAKIALKQGDPEDAIKGLESFVETSNNTSAAAPFLAMLYLQRNEPAKSLSLLKQQPKQGVIHALTAKAYVQLRDANNAEKAYLEWSKSSPVKASLKLAQLYNETRQYHKLVNLAQNWPVQTKKPEIINLLNIQALVALGRLDQAEQQLSQFQQLHPGRQMVILDEISGSIAIKRGEYAKGEQLFEKTFKIAPSSSRLLNWSLALTRNKQIGKSLALLSAWIDKNPDDVRVRQALAEQLALIKQYQAAFDQYLEVTKRQPENANALGNGAWLANELDDLPQANSLITKALKLTPDDPKLHQTYGRILLKQDQIELSIRQLNKAINSTDSPTTRYYLALAYSKAGDVEQARQLLAPLLGSSMRFAEREQALALANELK